MAYKINGTTVVDNSRNVTACCVTSCCITATTRMDAPSGNTASRPGSPATGSIYFDTDEGSLVAYDGSAWSSVGGSTSLMNVNEFSTGSNRGVSGCIYNNAECCASAVYELGYNNSTILFFYSKKQTCDHPNTTGGGDAGFSVKNGLTGEISSISGSIGNSSTTYCCGAILMNDQMMRVCGVVDEDPRATVPIFRHVACCNSIGFLDSTGYMKMRCTGQISFQCGGDIGASWNYARAAIFRQYGKINNECMCGLMTNGDSCCGVTIAINHTQIANETCGHCNFLDATFGYKPCYFYSTATCAASAQSPIRFQRMCGSSICCGSRRNAVAIDWANKVFWTVSGVGNAVNSCAHCAQIVKWCICDKGHPNCQSCWCMHHTPMCRLFTCKLNCAANHEPSTCFSYGRAKLQGCRIYVPVDCAMCVCGLFWSFPTTANSGASASCVYGLRLWRCQSSQGRNFGIPLGIHHDTTGRLRMFFAWKMQGMVNNTGNVLCSEQGVTEFVWNSSDDVRNHRITNAYEYTPARHCMCPGTQGGNNFCICRRALVNEFKGSAWLRCNNSLVGYNNLTGKRSITYFSYGCAVSAGQRMITSFITDEPAFDWQSGACCIMPDGTFNMTNYMMLCSRYTCRTRQCLDGVLPNNGYSWGFHAEGCGAVANCSVAQMACSNCGGFPLCAGFCTGNDMNVVRNCMHYNSYLALDNIANIRPGTWSMCSLSW